MALLPAEQPRDVSFAIIAVARQGSGTTDVSFFILIPRFTEFEEIAHSATPQKSI